MFGRLLRRNDSVDIENAAMMLGTDIDGVLNMVDGGELHPISQRPPMRFDKRELLRLDREMKARHAAFVEFIHAGEDMGLDDSQGVS